MTHVMEGRRLIFCIFFMWLGEDGYSCYFSDEVVEVLEVALGEVQVVELGGMRGRAPDDVGVRLVMFDILVQQNQVFLISDGCLILQRVPFIGLHRVRPLPLLQFIRHVSIL